MGDKEATEEDKQVFFEIEMAKKYRSSDKIRWTLNGRKIGVDSSSRYEIQANGNMLKLVIKNVLLEDEGNYAAELNNTKANGYLTVNELPPRFVKELGEVSGVEEQSAVLECELSKAKWKKTGLDVQVKWFKGQREVRDTTKHAIRKSGVKHSLEVRQLAFDDVGEYTAQVMGEKTTGRLVLCEAGVEFTSRMKDVEVDEKETAQFDVEVNKVQSSVSGETIAYQWYRKCADGEEQLSKSDGRFSMANIGKRLVLKISECEMEDAGQYWVQVGDARAKAKLTVNEIPVVFKRPLRDQTGHEAQSVTFEATVNREDKPVKWLVDGKPISREDLDSGKYVVKKDKCRLSLTINELSMERHHDVHITCQCGDKAKSKAKLVLDEEDIRFVERLTDSGVKEGEAITLTCRLNKVKYETRPNGKLSVRWHIKGKEVKPLSSQRHRTEQQDTLLKLTVSSIVSHEDAGEVKCTVNDKLVTTANLFVEEEPIVFIRPLQDLCLHEMPSEAKFEAELNKAFVDAKWMRNGEEISEADRRFTIVREGPVHRLTVKKADANDVGEYTIQLQGKSNKKSTASLDIKALCKMFLDAKYKDTITIKRGTTLDVEVPFTGYPVPTVEWTKEDETLRGTRVKTEMVKNKLVTLALSKTTRADSGKYTLTLENEVGREKCHVRVNVLDRPGPPRDPVVSEVYANEMKVSWTVPEDDGGSNITGYVVEVKEAGLQNWTEVDTKNYNELYHYVKRLTLGTKYAYRVSAVNKYGQSEPVESDSHEAKYPFSVPDAPINVTANDVTTDSCVVKFEPPKFDGGSPIIGYFIERKQTSTARWLRVNRQPVAETSVKVSDLVEDFEYEMRVIAVNKAGESLPSEPCKPFLAKNQFNRPSPPLNLAFGRVTKSSIELDWSEPESNGGTPITGYKIELFNSKSYKWQPVDLGRIHGCNVTVTGLKEGKEYELRAVATNKVGDSGPSEPCGPMVARDKIEGDKPEVLTPLKDLRVMVGETAKFKARVHAKPPPHIEWAHDEATLSRSQANFTSTYDNDNLELNISNVQVKDQGMYRVTVKNPLGQATTEARLTVLKRPAIKYDSRFDKVIEVVANDQNLNITTEITGHPRPVVTWFREGEEIRPDGAVSRGKAEFGEKFAYFNLKKIKRGEGGNYSVTAENEVGKADAAFVVKVLDVPLPPEELAVADISSYSCKLTWKVPADDGNSPITGYFIESFDFKRATWSRVDRSSLTEHYIDKLEKGKAYQFRVVAENKVGQSEPCTMEEPVLAKGKYDVPSAPTIQDISETTDSSCRVSWAPSRNDGGAPIRGYFVERRSAAKWIRVNKEPVDQLHYTVRDLVQGNDYEFRVCAINIEGEGAYSRESEPHNIRNKYTRPDPPVDLTVANITKSSCQLTWRPPIRNGGLPIVRYIVERRTRGEYKYVRFTDDFISECEYEIHGLIEGNEYEFRVYAENKMGESLPSDPTRTFKARDNVKPEAPWIGDMPDLGHAVGTQGKIEVKVTGVPTPDIKWKKGSRQINVNSSKYSISYAQNLAVLFINNLVEEDAGSYTIEAENQAGSETQSCKY